MKLYSEEHGQGQPLLLLTGLGYAIWSWQRQLPDWSRQFRCIAIENRGTGRSGGAGDAELGVRVRDREDADRREQERDRRA